MERFEDRVIFKQEEFDEKGDLSADRIFYYFQEISEGDVNARGVGPEDLVKLNQIWVLTKMKILIEDKLQPNVEYILGTFPVYRKSVTFKRDYYIKDDAGKIYIKGAAQWCILDYTTRKPLRTEIGFEEATEDEEMIPQRFPKIHCNDPQLAMQHVIAEEDIDFNDHTNNSRYIALGEEAVGFNVSSELYVYFANETRLGEEIFLYTEKQDDDFYVEGRRENGEIVFQLLFH